jgi:hypothetical protein
LPRASNQQPSLLPDQGQRCARRTDCECRSVDTYWPLREETRVLRQIDFRLGCRGAS